MIVPIKNKSQKAKKTRESILQAALDLFRKNGYDQTSMRDIAKEAGVAVGGAYYYFRTKDEMILEVYTRTQRESELRCRQTCQSTRSFRSRFLDLIFNRLSLMAEHRKLFVVLTQKGIDPANPLSPFSVETAHIREGAIGQIADAVENSDLIIASSLRPILPQLLWFFKMAIILFWALDNSPNQARTRRLVELSLNLMIPLFGMTRLPLAGIFNRLVLEIHTILKTLIREDPATTSIKQA